MVTLGLVAAVVALGIMLAHGVHTRVRVHMVYQTRTVVKTRWRWTQFTGQEPSLRAFLNPGRAVEFTSRCTLRPARCYQYAARSGKWLVTATFSPPTPTYRGGP